MFQRLLASISGWSIARSRVAWRSILIVVAQSLLIGVLKALNVREEPLWFGVQSVLVGSISRETVYSISALSGKLFIRHARQAVSIFELHHLWLRWIISSFQNASQTGNVFTILVSSRLQLLNVVLDLRKPFEWHDRVYQQEVRLTLVFLRFLWGHLIWLSVCADSTSAVAQNHFLGRQVPTACEMWCRLMHFSFSSEFIAVVQVYVGNIRRVLQAV